MSGFETTIQRGPALGAGILILLVLAACGGSLLSSYDAEKARMRAALPGDVACSESGGNVFECLSPGGGLKAGVYNAAGLMVDFMYDGNRGDDAAHGYVRKLADLYRFDEALEKTCREQGQSSLQTTEFTVYCHGNPDGFSARVTTDKASR